jgi:hypothetical protein
VCVTLATALSYATTAAQVASGVAAVHQATKGSGGGPDPMKAQAQADATAAQTSNARLAQRRRAMASQSLLTGGGDVMSAGVLGGGKPTLGG